ncbi:hypothetical protein DYE50_07960 [Treponema ruminis]|uniref:Uncharacterized protein n=1 Tax=Treponema ruminis TaxID=744515 RepID=A0A7W8LLT5_9SPIR|nr:Ig-like domain-containing protein [Treponema ruminis]MBB5225812.1 hypothetical protein [Treponema ruminis]QSI02501.1 hypothetical protein DYE50_07960 [Treponema ruminis]
MKKVNVSKKIFRNFPFSFFHFLYVITILLLGGGLLVSCNNILEGGDFKEQLEKDIAYANAKSLEIIVQPREGTGSTIPSGKQTVKQGYPLEIRFSEAGSYSFIKWIAVSQEDGSELEGIVFDDPKSPKTNVTVNIDSADVRIIPECSERIVVTEANPGYSDAGVSRDRAITVTFSKKPSKSSFIFSESEIPADATNKKAVFDDEKNEVPGEFWAYTLGGQTYLKNISITNSDGISLAEHFLQPELDGNILTVPVDRSNSIEIESGSSLTIVVTISDGICDDNGVTMNGEKQWRYRATEATDEKATLTLSCENDEGSVYLAGTRDYNISQKITLSFTENADYQFLRWNYDSKIVNIAEPDKINTTAIVVEKTDASEIKAVCAKRLRVSSFSPKIDDKTPSVSKNSSIIITFDHDLPTDAEGYAQLSNISIAVGGSPVKSSFLEPVINGSSVTFAADKTNMLEVPGDQTKTVTVSVPADFFYKTDDGAKVTFGGNGEVFNYKIDSTTLEKAEITFGAAKDSGVITPATGTYHYSIGSEIPLSFALSAGWQFNGWSVSGADQNVADKIKIADEKALSTKISVYEALQGVTVTAKTSECLRVTETSPSEKTNPKDSSIIITFNKPLAKECSALLDKIRVSSDGNSLDSYYTDRSISEISGDNGDFKQITIKNTSYLSVPKNNTKIITVTVPSDFYYNDGDTKISLAEYSFSFTIDHTTEAKTGITYKVVNGEDGSSLSAGTINRPSYEEYNIGEEVELSLDLYSGYQFYGWDITDSYGYSVTDQISYVNSNSSYLAPTLSINKPAEGITVSAICYKRPTISTSSVAPYSSNSAEEVAKNTPIVLTFDHAISDETKDEIIVTYSAISNFNKDSYFSTSISTDKKTVTLTPIKMLPLEHAYETVTVTVPCQKVYYLASDGRTKITPADKDFSWSYRVNSSTLTKTVVRFATNDAAVTGRQINAAGTLLSSGTKQDMNVEQTVNLEFPVESGYKFAGWKVESATTGYTVEPAGYVTSGTITVKNEDKSYFTLVIDGTNPAKAVITSNDAIGNGTDGYGITVLAKDVLLPAITEHTPSSENINPKDSTITITFNKNLAPSCSASLDLIKITMNGNDVSGFFEKRELKNNVITIKNTSLLDVTGSATKKITVTVPAVFYYEPEEGFRAYLSKEESFEYKIDSSTANKTKIRFDSSENSKKSLKVNEASTNDGGILAYNRGETVKLEYEVPAGYKFAGWKTVSPSSDYTVSTSDYVTSGTITVKNGEDTYLTLKVDSDNPVKAVVETIDAIEDYETSGYGIKVLAKDVEMPAVTSVTPGDGIQKTDVAIKLTFNMAMDASKLVYDTDKISITNGAKSMNELFEAPVLSENRKELTITPKGLALKEYIDSLNAAVMNLTVSLGTGITITKDGVSIPLLQNEKSSFTVSYKPEVEQTPPTKISFFATRKECSIAGASSIASADKFVLKQVNNMTKAEIFQNRTKGTVYLYGKYSDLDSGVSSVTVTQRLTNNTTRGIPDVSEETTTVFTKTTSGVEFKNESGGITTFCIPYEITEEDGAILLNVSVADAVGNKAEPTEVFSAIKKSVFYMGEYNGGDGSPYKLYNKCLGIDTSGNYDGDHEYRVDFSTFKNGINDFIFSFEDSQPAIYGSNIYDSDAVCLGFDNLTIQMKYTDKNNNQKIGTFTANGVSYEHHLVLDIDGYLYGRTMELIITDDMGNVGRRTYSFPAETDFLFLLEKQIPYRINYINVECPSSYVGAEFSCWAFFRSGGNYATVNQPIFREEIDYYPNIEMRYDKTGWDEGEDSFNLGKTNTLSKSLKSLKEAALPTVTVPSSNNYSIQKGNSDEIKITLNINKSSWNTCDKIFIFNNDGIKVDKSQNCLYFTEGSTSITFPYSAMNAHKNDMYFSIYGEKNNLRSSATTINIPKVTATAYDTVMPTIRFRFDNEEVPDTTTTSMRIASEYSDSVYRGETCRIYIKDDWSGPKRGTFTLPDGTTYNFNSANSYTVEIPFWKLLNEYNTFNCRYEIYDNNNNKAEGVWSPVIEDCFTCSNTTLTIPGSPLNSSYFYVGQNSGSWSKNDSFIADNRRTENLPASKFIKVTGYHSYGYPGSTFNGTIFKPLIHYTGSASSGKYDYILPNTENSILIASDAPVFAQTLVTNLPYSECSKWTAKEWEAFHKHVGDKYMAFSSSDHSPQKYTIPVSEIESGECYCVVVHFADNSTSMSEVKQK